MVANARIHARDKRDCRLSIEYDCMVVIKYGTYIITHVYRRVAAANTEHCTSRFRRVTLTTTTGEFVNINVYASYIIKLNRMVGEWFAEMIQSMSALLLLLLLRVYLTISMQKLALMKATEVADPFGVSRVIL